MHDFVLFVNISPDLLILATQEAIRVRQLTFKPVHKLKQLRRLAQLLHLLDALPYIILFQLLVLKLRLQVSELLLLSSQSVWKMILIIC